MYNIDNLLNNDIENTTLSDLDPSLPVDPCTCTDNCIVKNVARLEYQITAGTDTELATKESTSSEPTEFCLQAKDNRRIVGLKLFCKRRAFVGEYVTLKIVAVNQGNVGLTGVFVRDNLPAGLSFQNEVSVEVFNASGTFIPPVGPNAYTVRNTTVGNNVMLTLVRATSPSVLPYTLQPGWFVVFTFRVRVDATGTIQNSATVGANNTAEDPSNVIEVVGHRLRLTITKRIQGATSGQDFCVTCGDDITYLIDVENVSTSTLTPTTFTITDMFESVFDYTSTRITLGSNPTDISAQFNITPPTGANHNTLTITPRATFAGLGRGQILHVAVTGTIKCSDI